MKQLFNLSPLFWACALGAILMVCLTYSNHFNNAFEFDDSHTIVSNQAIRSLNNIPSFFVDAKTTSSLPANQAYRPVLTSLNTIDFWFGGKSTPVEFYYHRTIFVCFLVLGILLFFFFRGIFNAALDQEVNNYWALFAAAFFCLHAANAETINYIIARSDSFSTLMLMAAFLLVLKGGKYVYFSLLFLMLGLLTKEPVIVFPVLLFFYLCFFKWNYSLKNLTSKNNWKVFRPIFLKVSPFLLTAIVYYWFSRKMTPAEWSSGSSAVSLYLATQTTVYLHYIANFILPLNLSADTDWVLVRSWTDDRVIIGCLALIGSLLLVWKLSANQLSRPIAFGIIWFYVALLPTSSIFPLAEVLNDHRVFFPYIGLVLSAVWALALWVHQFKKSGLSTGQFKVRLVTLICVFMLVGHAYGTHQRNRVWSSAETLWKDVTEKSPKNARGLMNYGNTLMAKADWNGAEFYFNKALELWPNYSYLYINKAILKSATGKYSESEQLFNHALSLNGMNPEVYYYFGKFLKERGRLEEAIILLQRGLTISPGHVGCNQLMAECKSLSEKRKGMNTFDNCINQSLAYYNVGNYQKCIEYAEQALTVDPKSAVAYNNICAGYNGLKQWNKAIEVGEKGLGLNPGFQLLKNNIALAKKQLSVK